MANATETPAKRAKLATVNVEGRILTFEFADGVAVAVNVNDWPADMQEQSLMHGAEQKLRDSYAGAESPADARERMLAVAETVKAGDWKQRREGVEPDTALVIDALARMTGKPADEIREKWNAKTKDERSAIRKQPVVQTLVAEIKLERAKAKAAEQTPEQIAAMF